MPISLQIADPTAAASVIAGYCWLSHLSFDFLNQTARFVYLVHRDEAASYANKQPLATIELNVGPEGKPAVLTMITPEVPYQPAQYEPITGNLISPEVPYQPPTYGEPVLVPAVPSFQELIMQNIETYQALKTAVYAFALTQPQFAGGTIV